MADTDPSSLADLERAVALLRSVAAYLTDADLARPTPCTDWDVGALVGHVVGLYDGITGALHGRRADLLAPRPRVDSDAARAVDDASARMLAAWHEPGALDRTLATNVSDMPGALSIRIAIGDSLLHSWDLATAFDRPVELPDDLAAAQLVLMQQFYDPSRRGPGTGFDLAVEWPDDAPVEQRLLALSGRRPRPAP
jgi:uncharacterized protein (TIGR03086 family)